MKRGAFIRNIRSAAALAVGVAFAVGCGDDKDDDGPVGTIHLRALFDLTGDTSDVGVSWSKGMLDWVGYLNANDGVRNHTIDMLSEDAKYKSDLSEQIWQTWSSDVDAWEKVLAVLGYGTGPTLALAPLANDAETPLFTTSYAADLGSPKPVSTTVDLYDNTSHQISVEGAPYVFYPGTDYSSSCRIAMQFAKDKGAKKVAFAYCKYAYCASPILAGKDYAKSIGLEVAPDLGGPDGTDYAPELDDEYPAIENKVKAYFANTDNQDIEWIWMGNTTKTAVFFAVAVARHGPSNAKVIVNVWGFDETFYGRCGELLAEGEQNPCVDRVYGLSPFAAFGDTSVLGMEQVLEIHKWGREKASEDLSLYNDIRYIQAHVTFLSWKIATERLIDAGAELTGPNLKAELESFAGVSTGGLTAPLTYTAEDHRPTSGAKIYSINSHGKLEFEGEADIDLKPEWVGW